ncbi:MAG: carboxynorspermidine decarboxylase [Muribaculaceae bacterium]|nr:carboxynorspermidine decarboxylase [Muribaculaceae bacterium]
MIETPYYIAYESKIEKNLSLIKHVSEESGAEIIMAFKANALWKSFDIFRRYGVKSTASSLNEMLLGNEELHQLCHTYCPVYTDRSFPEFLKGSDHITFNSIAQFEKFKPQAEAFETATGRHVSLGLRINPEISVIETDIYNPCAPGARFGVTIENMPEHLPSGIEGFHFHALCESTSYDLEKVLSQVESAFGKYLDGLKWINFGGGHLMTRKGYDTDHLISLIKGFKKRHPNLHVILEPGSAFTWRTGDLIASVLDIVENSGIMTAIVDVSFACHMPDCLEMPYKPTITEALPDVDADKPTYRIGGNSCLSGDFVGDWSFEQPLKVGDILTFEDMNHYTTVKTNMFNGIQHPALYLQRNDGTIQCLRCYTYEDYKNRMS